MDLHSLGWNARWQDAFAPYAADHLVPGRIVVEHRGAYRIEMDAGERMAALAGRFRHRAERRSDLPAVGDFVAARLPDGEGPAIVEQVLPRHTAFVRKAAGPRLEDQVVAANIDTAFVMMDSIWTSICAGSSVTSPPYGRAARIRSSSSTRPTCATRWKIACES